MPSKSSSSLQGSVMIVGGGIDCVQATPHSTNSGSCIRLEEIRGVGWHFLANDQPGCRYLDLKSALFNNWWEPSTN